MLMSLVKIENDKEIHKYKMNIPKFKYSIQKFESKKLNLSSHTYQPNQW